MAKQRKAAATRKPPVPSEGHADIEDWIRGVMPDLHPIVKRMDGLIRETIPGLQYAIKWKKAYYGLPELGWIIEMVAYDVSVNVVFLGGAELRASAAARNHRSDPLRQGEDLGGGAGVGDAELGRASGARTGLEMRARRSDGRRRASVADGFGEDEGRDGAAASFQQRRADHRERPPRVDEVVDQQRRLSRRDARRPRTRPRRSRTAGASSRARSAASSRASSRRSGGTAGRAPLPDAPQTPPPPGATSTARTSPTSVADPVASVSRRAPPLPRPAHRRTRRPRGPSGPARPTRRRSTRSAPARAGAAAPPGIRPFGSPARSATAAGARPSAPPTAGARAPSQRSRSATPRRRPRARHAPPARLGAGIVELLQEELHQALPGAPVRSPSRPARPAGPR